MGYAISRIAVRGKSADAICKQLGLSRTEEFENTPDSTIVGADLPGGWYLVWGNDMTFTGKLPLDEISTRAEVVEFWVEEHVMVSGARGWANGEEQWSVEHDPGRGIMHLDARGHLPAAFVDIRDRLLREQEQTDERKAKVDHAFSIPIELARTLTGFAYGRDIPGATDEDSPFENLEAVEESQSAHGRPERGSLVVTFLFLALLICAPVLLVVLGCLASAGLRWLLALG
jgi:hypothetical protein